MAHYPRQVSFEITLRKYESFSFVESKPNAPLRETLYVTAKRGETWEHIALRMYGKPEMGELIRRRNPAALMPAPGVIYKLPDKDVIIFESAEPYSISMARSPEGLSRFSEMLAIRNEARYARSAAMSVSP